MPSGDIPVRRNVELEQGGRTVEARTDSEVDDGERSDDVIAVLKLPVEYREEPGKPRMRIGDDARIVAGLLQDFRLDEELPVERVDGGLGSRRPPEEPLNDQRRFFCVGATEPPHGMFRSGIC